MHSSVRNTLPEESAIRVELRPGTSCTFCVNSLDMLTYFMSDLKFRWLNLSCVCLFAPEELLKTSSEVFRWLVDMFYIGLHTHIRRQCITRMLKKGEICVKVTGRIYLQMGRYTVQSTSDASIKDAHLKSSYFEGRIFYFSLYYKVYSICYWPI